MQEQARKLKNFLLWIEEKEVWEAWSLGKEEEHVEGSGIWALQEGFSKAK